MASLDKKQELLRHQVLEGGLNAEEFIEYLGTVKNQGENVDLDNWTMNQLKKAIEDFKAKRQKSKFDLMNSRMSLNIIKKSKIFETIIKREKVFYENSQLWDFQMNQLQDCSKSDVHLKLPEKGKPQVKVEKWEVKQVGGFIFGIGSRNQLHLTIVTNFSDEKVQRKSEDIDWLRKILAVDYPGHFLPYLEEDRELNAEDVKGISTRIAEIEGFLNKIMKYTPFQYSRHVHVFFEEHSLKKFTQFRNREALLQAVRDPDTLQTPTGTFMVEISDKMNKKLKSGSTVAQQFNNLYHELLNCSYKISGYMQKLKKQIGFLYDISSKLGQKYSEVQQLFKLEESKLPTIFLSFSNISNNTFRNLERQMKAFSNFTDHWTRDVSRDWGQFIAHDSKVQKEQKKYLYEKESLIRRKQKYVSELNKWQLPEGEYLTMKNKDLSSMTKEQKFEKMFPSDTDNQNRYKIWLSGLNQNYVQSYKAFLRDQESFLLEKYFIYSGEALCTCKDMLNNYEEFNHMIFG